MLVISLTLVSIFNLRSCCHLKPVVVHGMVSLMSFGRHHLYYSDSVRGTIESDDDARMHCQSVWMSQRRMYQRCLRLWLRLWLPQLICRTSHLPFTWMRLRRIPLRQQSTLHPDGRLLWWTTRLCWWVWRSKLYRDGMFSHAVLLQAEHTLHSEFVDMWRRQGLRTLRRWIQLLRTTILPSQLYPLPFAHLMYFKDHFV